jgi:hypothetical protein
MEAIREFSTALWKFRSSKIAPIVENPVIEFEVRFDDRIFKF